MYAETAAQYFTQKLLPISSKVGWPVFRSKNAIEELLALLGPSQKNYVIKVAVTCNLLGRVGPSRACSLKDFEQLREVMVLEAPLRQPKRPEERASKLEISIGKEVEVTFTRFWPALLVGSGQGFLDWSWMYEEDGRPKTCLLWGKCSCQWEAQPWDLEELQGAVPGQGFIALAPSHMPE